jgi:Ca2+-binding EF-hand superfamily protein
LNKLAVTKTGNYDWGGLYSMYDKNLDNLMDKNELREMVIACGDPFKEVTEAEVAFIFNVMSFFQKYLKKETFLEWVAVRLISLLNFYYSLCWEDPRRI